MILIKAGGGKDINWEGISLDVYDLMQTEKVILVHGASVRRDEIAERLSIPVNKVVSPSGITSIYTDREALDVFLMAYAGLVNKHTVACLQRHGINAVGLCGVDGRLWQAKAKKEILIREGAKTKLLKDNLTGRVERINTELIGILLEHGYLPVICAPALSFENEIVNTDNDWAVAVMAEQLGIRKLVYLFEAPGLLRNPDQPESLIPRIEKGRMDECLEFARGRMKKKVLGVKRAFEGGVETVYWGDGRIDRPVKSALAGKGTVIC
ncbi:MAG: [LysW]-aminoadipate kinase [Candidatus Aminicenantales bacterium]